MLADVMIALVMLWLLREPPVQRRPVPGGVANVPVTQALKSQGFVHSAVCRIWAWAPLLASRPRCVMRSRGGRLMLPVLLKLGFGLDRHMWPTGLGACDFGSMGFSPAPQAGAVHVGVSMGSTDVSSNKVLVVGRVPIPA